MADQHNSNIPALANVIASDVPDIKENLEYHKDVFQNYVGTWSDTVATGVYPHKFADQSGTQVILQCTVLDIGEWNMDADATVSVSHSITLSKIRSVTGIIRDDSGNVFPITPGYVSTAAEVDINIQSIGAATIVLNRKGSGDFDSTSYNATSYNRGYLMVWHTV